MFREFLQISLPHATDIAETDGTTRMTLVSTFASVEQLDQLVAMGMQEGLTLAVGQIEDILAGAAG